MLACWSVSPCWQSAYVQPQRAAGGPFICLFSYRQKQKRGERKQREGKCDPCSARSDHCMKDSIPVLHRSPYHKLIYIPFFSVILWQLCLYNCILKWHERPKTPSHCLSVLDFNPSEASHWCHTGTWEERWQLTVMTFAGVSWDPASNCRQSDYFLPNIDLVWVNHGNWSSITNLISPLVRLTPFFFFFVNWQSGGGTQTAAQEVHVQSWEDEWRGRFSDKHIHTFPRAYACSPELVLCLGSSAAQNKPPAPVYQLLSVLPPADY